MYSTAKRVVVGSPLESHLEGEQRLGKPTALAVFASDAISSTAYATEEILVILALLGSMAYLGLSIPIAIAITDVFAGIDGQRHYRRTRRT